MSRDAELEARFAKLGGVFMTPTSVLRERLRGIRGLVSDWDGVFNAGSKGDGTSSTFGEPDSMGMNLLRYALWRERGALPALRRCSSEPTNQVRQTLPR